MDIPIYRDGQPLPTEMIPVPGLERVYCLRAVHGPGWLAASYFVQRNAGNLLVSPLVYTPALGDFIDVHGGLDLVFITHRDELEPDVLSEVGREGPGEPPAAVPACEYRVRFGCRIAVHEADAKPAGDCRADLVWSANTGPHPGLSFIHTPGHTPGSASLLVADGGRRLLFCGDAVSLDDGAAIATDIDDEEMPAVPAMLDAWRTLARHEFDALIPLHTYGESPVPCLATAGSAALGKALDELAAWWDDRTRDRGPDPAATR